MSKLSLDDIQGYERCEFEPGDILFSEGESSFFFFVIEQGEVEVFLPAKATDELVLDVAKKGQSVGEFALIVKKPRSASARAKTKVTAIKISASAYQNLIKNVPSWCLSVMESLMERLRRADEMLKTQSADKAKLLNQIKTLLG